jgi:hypothetical protein
VILGKIKCGGHKKGTVSDSLWAQFPRQKSIAPFSVLFTFYFK